MLITLAIIGVVAALTIPTLVQNYRKKVVETKLVQFYSTFQQAMQRSEIDNGSIKYFSQNPTKEDIQEWFNTYIEPYINYSSTYIEEATGFANSPAIIVLFNNGSAVQLKGTWSNSWLFFPDAKDIKLDVFQDNNGDEYNYYDKNSFGIKIFTFRIDNAGRLVPYVSNFDASPDIDELKNNPVLGCNPNASQERAYCTKLIQLNNWKIPEDYPFKF